MEIFIHPRIMERHPEISEDGVLSAWVNIIRMKNREGPAGEQVAAVGFDKKGRLLEMVAVSDKTGYLVYHAMTPPTRKMLVELGLSRR